MTFTYAGDLSTDLEKVRFYLNDTVSGSGPKPSSGNFTDEELGGLIAAEGSWQRAVAGGFETLASAWATKPDERVAETAFSFSQISDSYAESGKEWRSRYGGSASSVGSTSVVRVDGYSDDVASDDA